MRLPFMPETWSIFLPSMAAGWLLWLWGAHDGNGFLLSLAVALLALAALILNFFRDFERVPRGPLGPKDLLSPADGKVVQLRVVKEDLYLKRPCLQVAIFMNPLDNHVQRVPFDAKVVRKEYHRGEFLKAYDDKADLRNEQAHLVMECKAPSKRTKGRVRLVMKQIAGFLTHRIRTIPEKGDAVARGERIGRILLGSRVDLFLPRGFKSRVRLGDRVLAGVTVLGELP